MPLPSPDQLASIDDYLNKANGMALDFIENHIQFKLFYNVDCFTYAIYTYAAFLLLTNNGIRDFQNNVRLSWGLYVSKDGSGKHSYLEIKVGEEWKPFEPIPWNHDEKAKYRNWSSIQIVGQKLIFGKDTLSYPYLTSYLVDN